MARHGIRGLIIDPYNEIEHKRPAAMSETEYVSQLLGKVKRFAQTRGSYPDPVEHCEICRWRASRWHIAGVVLF